MRVVCPLMAVEVRFGVAPPPSAGETADRVPAAPSEAASSGSSRTPATASPCAASPVESTDVRSAAEELLKFDRRGPMWRNAVQMCTAALEGKRPSNVARKAFEAAARESGMLIER